MVDELRKITDEVRGPDEEYPDDERWTRLVCPNGHEEKVEDRTADLQFYCPECGERRSVETNYIAPETTKSDKI